MKRLARCALAALLAASFAAPVLASPPPVAAPNKVGVTELAGGPSSLTNRGSDSLPTLIVSVATDPPIPKPVPRFVPIPTPAATPAPTLAPVPAPRQPTVADAQAYALSVLGATQYRCLYSVIQAESRWRVTVWNGKGSGAYGLGQAKPGSKMAAFGADWATNPITQVRWVIWYATAKYGSPCGAAFFRDNHGWY